MISDQMLEEKIKALKTEAFRLVHRGHVDEFIDRSQVEVPSTFVPSATGFGVDESLILYLAHPQGMYGVSPRWWWRGGVREHLFKTYTNDCFSYLLCGYGCTLDGYKQLWSIERKREVFREPKVHDVLALDSTPIFFTYPKAAKVLAQLCCPNPRKEAQAEGVRWIPITT